MNSELLPLCIYIAGYVISWPVTIKVFGGEKYGPFIKPLDREEVMQVTALGSLINMLWPMWIVLGVGIGPAWVLYKLAGWLVQERPRPKKVKAS